MADYMPWPHPRLISVKCVLCKRELQLGGDGNYTEVSVGTKKWNICNKCMPKAKELGVEGFLKAVKPNLSSKELTAERKE